MKIKIFLFHSFWWILLFSLDFGFKNGHFWTIIACFGPHRIWTFRTAIFRQFFQSKKSEFDRAARSRPQSWFFLFIQVPWNDVPKTMKITWLCPHLCFIKSAVVLKGNLSISFCEKSNKRIHFNYEKIWFFFNKWHSCGVLIWAIYVFKLVKVHYSGGGIKRSRRGLIATACQNR